MFSTKLTRNKFQTIDYKRNIVLVYTLRLLLTFTQICQPASDAPLIDCPTEVLFTENLKSESYD